MRTAFLPALVACAGALTWNSPADAAAATGLTLGAGLVASIAVSAGATAGATAIIGPTTWWGKALTIAGGSVVTGVLDPPGGAFYNGDFTIHYNSGDLMLQQTGWLGDWGANSSLAAPPVDPSGGFPTGATFVMQQPNPLLTASTVNNPSAGLVTTTFDWGPAGKAVPPGHFNFFGFAFQAVHTLTLRYLGTSATPPAGANLSVTTTGMFCKPPGDDMIQLCGSPETMYFQTSVPEPATWGMMILGFGLIGAAMRRRVATRVSYPHGVRERACIT